MDALLYEESALVSSKYNYENHDNDGSPSQVKNVPILVINDEEGNSI